MFTKLFSTNKNLIKILNHVWKRKYSTPKDINFNIRKECLKYPPMNITITGSNCEVGQLIAFFLKQEPIVNKLFLYDTEPCLDIVEDLDIIGTKTETKCFCGIKCLPHAIEDARIIVICGGHSKFPDRSVENLFYRNVDYVREIVMYCAEFNPHCHICIVTPPVSALVPMAVEECKKADLYNHKRIYGIVTTNVIRAQALAATELGIKGPILVPAVGGDNRRTFIPILSQSAKSLSPPKNEMITRSIQEGEEDILHEKFILKDTTCCYLSIANAAAKFVLSLAQAIQGGTIHEPVYVKQEKPLDQIAKYLTTYVTLNECGVKESKIPKLSDRESYRFKQIINVINDNIFLGESYITGDDKPVIRNVKVEELTELPKMKIVCSAPIECYGQAMPHVHSRVSKKHSFKRKKFTLRKAPMIKVKC